MSLAEQDENRFRFSIFCFPRKLHENVNTFFKEISKLSSIRKSTSFTVKTTKKKKKQKKKKQSEIGVDIYKVVLVITVFFMVSVATMSELSSRRQELTQSEKRLIPTRHSTTKWRPCGVFQTRATLTRSFPCLCSNLNPSTTSCAMF